MTRLVRPVRYAGVFTAVALVGALLVTAIERAMSWDVPTALMTILPPMVAALLEGSRIGRETGAPLPKGAWLPVALLMTGIALVIKLILGGLILTFLLQAGLVAGIPWGPVAVMVGFDIVATFVVNAAFLVMGVRNELRNRTD